MNSVNQILDSTYPPKTLPLRIVETGVRSTRQIAKWISDHQECKFESIDLDGKLQEATHLELEIDGTARYCTFHTQSPNKFLSAATWIDVVFLNPSDLQSGEEEFSLAISAGARSVIMSDYQARAAKAIIKARKLGWKYTQVEDYLVLRRS